MFSSSGKPDASEYINLEESVGKLLIVRPLEYKTDFVTTFSPQGTDVVFADIAVVDDVDPATQQQGRVWRSQAILQGYLKGTFKRKIGETIIGMLYKGVPKGGRPPFMWQDLFGDPAAVARGTAWLQANQSFLVQLQPSAAPAQVPTYTPPPAQGGIVAQGPPAYVAPAAAAPAASVGMTTLDQLKQMSLGGDVNHHGQPQADNAPF